MSGRSSFSVRRTRNLHCTASIGEFVVGITTTAGAKNVRRNRPWTIVGEKGLIGKGFSVSQFPRSIANEIIEVLVFSHDVKRNNLGRIIFLL